MPRQRVTRSTTPPAPRATRWSPGVADVVIVALLACVAGIANQFAHDDLHLILENARVQDLGNLREIFARPYWPPPFSQDLYRPMATLFAALQYALGGGDPVVFRIVSYAMYAAASAGVFLFARRFVAIPVAAAGALLFAAHPVHVEAIALGVGQNELAVGILALLMTATYMKRRANGSLGARDWGLLALLYAVACLFKENALVIPGLLLAAELLLVGDAGSGTRAKLLPGYLLLAAVAAGVLGIRYVVLGELRGTFVAEALDGVSTGRRLLTVLQVVPEWIRLLVWPAHLRLDYGPQEFVASTGFGLREALGATIVVAAAWIAWWSRRRAPLIAFGLCWTAIALFPVSNLVVPTGVLIAERTLFVPSIGFILALTGGVQLALSRYPGAAVRKAAIALCAIAVVAGLLRSAERQRVWRHDGFLSVRTASDAPRSFRAQRAYADVLFEIQQPEAAHRAYASAISYAPPQLAWRVRNDYARQLRNRGERAAEAEQLRASLAQKPEQGDARGHLVAAYLALGQYGQAARQADSASAHGGDREVFSRMRALADSAQRVGAPAGSIRIGVTTGPRR